MTWLHDSKTLCVALLASVSVGTASAQSYPLEIEHTLGTTMLSEKPERVATVAWANHEVPLALGVVPVGFAAANFGDENGNGLLPWVDARRRAGRNAPPCSMKVTALILKPWPKANPM
ncbi:hypothetical protein HSBAA_11840 [Vreelandella sulfidaeris]|uniref:Uncharacterized protein n=1 Tax=Vreelandella sulfidaeris TaxID=115553 RepID=A0A455U6I8_9GAMM|nr:hypothetical protein HSBAA_11840 [Halomonas sulfidaeris]